MKYTKNYQLNQWDAADRVLREDFNTDNREVDTALAAVQAACPWSKLAETPTTLTRKPHKLTWICPLMILPGISS